MSKKQVKKNTLRPLLLLKAKGLTGPLMTQHAGSSVAIKAMGNFKQDKVV